MTWVNIGLGVVDADGDPGPGDHPQVHPGPPHPPAMVRIRCQHTAPHSMVLRPSLQQESFVRGGLEHRFLYLEGQITTVKRDQRDVSLRVDTLCVIVMDAETLVVPGARHPEHAELLLGGACPHAEHPGGDTGALEPDTGPLTDIMPHQHLAAGNHCGLGICDEL